MNIRQYFDKGFILVNPNGFQAITWFPEMASQGNIDLDFDDDGSITNDYEAFFLSGLKPDDYVLFRTDALVQYTVSADDTNIVIEDAEGRAWNFIGFKHIIKDDVV